ncbi:hypothetical protein MHBO_005024, partial [Bonamia ostreae]
NCLWGTSCMYPFSIILQRKDFLNTYCLELEMVKTCRTRYRYCGQGIHIYLPVPSSLLTPIFTLSLYSSILPSFFLCFPILLFPSSLPLSSSLLSLLPFPCTLSAQKYE